MSKMSHKQAGLLIVATLMVAAVTVVGILQLTHVTHFLEKKNPQASNSISSSANNQKGETTPTPTQTQTTTQPGDVKSNNGGSGAVSLAAPSGDFVSSHHVGMSTTEVSVCNSSPGASCQIAFSMNGAVKSLPSQTTDRGGSTYWNGWTPASIGLAPGNWIITATATLNGQTQSTVDGQSLAVGQ